MGQRASKKKVSQELYRSTTETRKGDRKAKGGKTFSSVKNTVSNLSVKINDRAIRVKKGQGPSHSWPVERTKGRSKLFNAMGVSNSFGQQVEITELGSQEETGTHKSGSEEPKTRENRDAEKAAPTSRQAVTKDL